MAAIQVDLHIEQGADWPGLLFPILDGDDQPYPVAECTAKAQIRHHPGFNPPLFTWSSNPGPGEGRIILSGNTVSLRVTAAESSAWAFRQGRYDLELTNPSAPVGQQVIRVASGSVFVDQEVTL